GGISSIRSSGFYLVNRCHRPLRTLLLLSRRSLAEDRWTPSLLQFHSQPLADGEFFVVAILLGILCLFELRVFFLVDWFFTDHVNDQCRVLILQKFGRLVDIEIDAIYCHEPGELGIASGINQSKRRRRLDLGTCVF